MKRSEQDKQISNIKSLIDSIHQTHETRQEVSEIPPEHSEAYFELRRRALKYIGIDRGKSFGQVMQKLNQDFSDKEYSRDLKVQVIEQLIADQYLDERLCGRRIIKRHSGRKQKSKRYLLHLMEQQGISRDMIRELSDEILPDEETASAYFLLRKKEWDFTQPEKIMRHFASRGFSSGIILKIMREYANGEK